MSKENFATNISVFNIIQKGGGVGVKPMLNNSKVDPQMR